MLLFGLVGDWSDGVITKQHYMSTPFPGMLVAGVSKPDMCLFIPGSCQLAHSSG